MNFKKLQSLIIKIIYSNFESSLKINNSPEVGIERSVHIAPGKFLPTSAMSHVIALLLDLKKYFQTALFFVIDDSHSLDVVFHSAFISIFLYINN